MIYHHRIISSVVLIALLLALMLHQPLTAGAQQGFELVPLSEEVTNVYGMLSYRLPGNLLVHSAYYIEDKSVLVAAGNGFIAGVSVAPGEKPAIIWRQSLIGNATVVSAASYTSSWAAVGSDAGEIVIINVDDPNIRADFYTASRDAVKSLALSPLETPIVAAIDEQGYLYLLGYGETGWVEIGPDSHGGALKSYPTGNAIINIISQVKLFDGVGYLGQPVAIALPGGAIGGSEDIINLLPGLSVTVKANIFYRTETGGIAPAITSTVTREDGATISRTLYYAIAPVSGAQYTWPPSGIDYRDGKPVRLSVNPSEAENNVEFAYLAGPAKLVALYVVEEYSSDGLLAAFSCYYVEASFAGKPGDIVDLGNLVAEPVVAADFGECVSRLNLRVFHDFTYFQPVLVVSLSSTPSQFAWLKDAYLIMIPVPGDNNSSGLSDATVIDVYSVPNDSPLAEKGVSIILVAGDSTDSLALIYMLDSSWGLVEGLNENPVVYYLGSNATSIAIGSEATAIYLGTENGHIYRFLWNGERFYAANALAIDSEGSIASIMEIENGGFLITSSSNGVVQLIDLALWKPMWRGLPGFSGVATGINGLTLQGSTLNLLVGFSLVDVEGEASDRIYVFTPRGTDLNPILVDASMVIRKLDGGSLEPALPEGSYAALADEEGNILAKELFVDGRALLYAPSGTYSLLLHLEGYGVAKAPLNVEPPLVNKRYVFEFVEAKFSAYTPNEPSSPEAAIAYTLLAGPRPGATLSFDVVNYYGSTEYTPIISSFEVVTGEDGTAVALLWSNTVYRVTAFLEGFRSAAIAFDSGSQSEAAIELHPILYRVNVKVIDAEVYRVLSQEFTVKNAILTIALGDRSAKITITSGTATIYLARGSYSFLAEAPAYESSQVNVAITGATSITLLLEPQRITVPIYILLVDDVAGVANGPLPQASVRLELVDPPLDYSFEGVTSDNGLLLAQGLRPGVYRITVTDPVIGSTTVDGVEILGSDRMEVRVKPIYVNVALRLVDADLLVPAAGSFNVTLIYERIPGANATLLLDTSSATLRLPKGVYTITISSREGYYYTYSVTGEVIVEDSEITIPLSPVKITVTISVVYSDDETGLASGGVANALVELQLVEPKLPFAKITGVTGANGSLTLVLRAGVYEVKVASPVTEEASTKIVVGAADLGQRGEQTVIVPVKPLYTTINVSLVDRDLLKPLPAALLRVEWQGATAVNSKVLSVVEGQTTIRVPLGRLALTGILDGYYKPTTVQLTLNTVSETSVTILMDPLIVNTIINTVYEQQVVEIGGVTTTLPRAPAPNVKVTIIPDDDMLEYLGIQGATLVTADDGSTVAPLRGGKYRVVLEGAHIEPAETSIIVSSDNTNITISVKPILYNVTLTVVDPELREDVRSPERVVIKILVFNGVNVNLELITGPVIEATLPAGNYTISLSSVGYAESVQDIAVNGDASLTLTLKPITREVFFSVTADTVLGVSQNVGGKLLLEAVNIPLRNPVIEVDVRQGQAVALLRLGEYNIYYLVPEADLRIPVTTILVEEGSGQLQVSLTVKPPKVNLALALVDSELEIPVNNATVDVIYVGPLGQYAQTIENVNGSLQIEMPPGVVVVNVEAPGYQTARHEVVVKPDRVDTAIRLNPLLYDVQLRLVDQDGVPIEDEVVITLIHRELPYTKEVRGNGPTIQVAAVRPGSYQVVVVPVNSDRLDESQAQITIEPPGVATPDTIQVNFKLFKVTLTLVDAAKGDTIPFPYKAVIERVTTGLPTPLEITREVTIQGSAQVTLPYGDYTITLTPEGPDYYVVDEPFNITVDRDGEITIKLQPRVYVVTVVVTDDNNRPLANSFVRVTDAEGNEIQSGYTDPNGFFVFRATFGTYSVTVNHPGYHTAERVISVPQNTNITISLEPGIRVLLLRYGPLVTGFASLAIIAVLIYRMRSTLSERLLKEEEYF